MKPTTKSESEIKKFELMANEWWNPNGKFKPLHQLNPVRIEYILNQCKNMFPSLNFQDIKTLDIGCGGGLVCENLARLNFNVTGIDASKINIEVAKSHAAKVGLNINYQAVLAEKIKDKKFKLVLALEIVEHVENLEFFVRTCFSLVEDGGIIIFSTMNKTIKSYLESIIAAEYILNWVPKGTHDWSKFAKPSEIVKIAESIGGNLIDLQGLGFSLIHNKWHLTKNVSNNYFIVFRK